MADEKKPEAFDPEKTVVDRRGANAPAAPAEGERTNVAPPSDAPAEGVEGERTMILSRDPAPGSVTEPGREDATMIAPAGRPASVPVPGASPESAGRIPAASRHASTYQLVSLSGETRGRRYPIPEGETILGSDPAAGVSLPGAEPQHARIVRRGDTFEIQNLGTKGSILVRGRNADQATVRRGELAKIGEAVVRFVRVGDVFANTYSPAELTGGGFQRFTDPAFLKENPRYLAIGALALVMLVLFLVPAPEPEKSKTPKKTSKVDVDREKRIQSLLAAGEVLFNAGKLLPPDDKPGAETALGKFNEVLVLDPGNPKALEWLGKLDAENKRLAEERAAGEERDRQAKLDAEERDRRERAEAEERDRAQREEEERKQREAEEAERARNEREMSEKIAAYLAEGDKLFAAGRLLEPAGKNALAFYRKALEVYPESKEASERVEKVIAHFVEGGDAARDKGDLWAALESYRRGLRAMGGENEAVQARIQETETRLRSGIAGGDTLMIMWRDEKGKFVVVDDAAKVPSSAKDRALEIPPGAGGGSSGGGYE